MKPPRQLPVVRDSLLPPLYAAWLAELLDGPIPPETGATCADCAMLSPEAPHGSAEFFNPQTKCCAYVPALPNFLVGRLLADDDPATVAGRATVSARLQAGLNVTPLGLASSPVFTLLYERGEHLFGRSQTLRCPHYLAGSGGQCGVWQQRNAICSTWFCKYARGAVGLKFWQTLRDLLATVEEELARYCVLELEVGSAALAQLFPPLGSARSEQRLDVHQIDGVADSAAQRAVWGAWAGREVEFFQACARLINPLRWAQVLAICGPAAKAHARLAVEAHRRLLAHELPARLKVGEFKLVLLEAGRCRVVSYNGYDPLELSQRLFSVLGYFDGRPTAEVLQRLAAEQHLRLNAALVQRLVDFGILVSCES